MAYILNIETATKVCSVALARDGESIAVREHFGAYAHAEKLTVFVEEVLKEAKLSFSDLSAVAVSKGPGSYTGLRIGVSAAKGFAFTLEIPLLAVSTLEGMTLNAIEKIKQSHPELNPATILFCPMIDARRMEVYCAVYDAELQQILPVAAEIITESSFEDILKNHQLCFFGDGAQKCEEALGNNPNAVFLKDVDPSANAMIPLAYKLYQKQKFEDVAYFEPYYLKEFLATVPKNKI
ncbi:MAG: tRNA (adenosine(37)-N6)-threonylcarbamoyltransferase complex dimerization subunit type 1 TsaB [Bacteroidetes bacterium]|nr:tRNA (adenosine(37)-N6)-threonylcarbamoyltransferase complex dimerization subunit type 1 TsaB [Bacteroidota bacterium]